MKNYKLFLFLSLNWSIRRAFIALWRSVHLLRTTYIKSSFDDWWLTVNLENAKYYAHTKMFTIFYRMNPNICSYIICKILSKIMFYALFISPYIPFKCLSRKACKPCQQNAVAQMQRHSSFKQTQLAQWWNLWHRRLRFL
jgi:hypothetical protein